MIHLYYDWPEFINDIHVGRTILISNPHPTDLPGLNLSWHVRNPPCLQVASEPHLSLTTTESFTGLKLRHTNYKLSKHTWHNDFFFSEVVYCIISRYSILISKMGFFYFLHIPRRKFQLNIFD